MTLVLIDEFNADRQDLQIYIVSKIIFCLSDRRIFFYKRKCLLGKHSSVRNVTSMWRNTESNVVIFVKNRNKRKESGILKINLKKKRVKNSTISTYWISNKYVLFKNNVKISWIVIFYSTCFFFSNAILYS